MKQAIDASSNVLEQDLEAYIEYFKYIGQANKNKTIFTV